MATVIDSLLVTLGLDASGLRKGAADSQKTVEDLRKTVQKAGQTSDETTKRWTKSETDAQNLRRKHAAEQNKLFKDQEEQGKKLTAGLNAMKGELLGVIAAFTGGAGIKDFVVGTIEGNAELGRMAEQLGVTAQQMSNWVGVAEHFGGTASDAAQSLQAVVRMYTQLSTTGQTAGMGVLQAMGLTMDDLQDANQGLLNIATGVERLRGQGFSTARIGQQLGQLGLAPGVIEAEEQGRQAVQNLLDTQEKANKLSDADVKAAAARAEAWADLNSEWKQVKTQLSEALMPTIIAITDAMKGFVDWAKANPKTVALMFEAITAAVIGLGVALGVVLVATSEITVPVLLLGAAFAALSPAIMPGLNLIKGALDHLWTAVKRVLDQFDPAFLKAVGDGIKQGLLVPFRALADVLNYIADLFDLIGDAMKGDWSQFAKDAGKALLDYGKVIGHSLGLALPGDAAGSTAAAGQGAAAAGAPPTGGSGVDGSGRGSISQRNNNAGNIVDPRTGAFVQFGNPLAGAQAMAHQLLIDFSRHGQRTVAQIINDPKHGWSNEWAKGNTHAGVMNYIAYVARALGVGADTQLNLNDPAQLARMMEAMGQFESGKKRPFDPAIYAQAAGMSVGAGASPGVSNRSRSSSVQATTNIQAININVPTADPNTIGRGIRAGIERNAYVPQFATGQV